MTEILCDRALGLPPLNRPLARRMMESIRGYPLLKGHRAVPGSDLALVEELLMRLSQLVTDFHEIVELDINPMVATTDQAWALDARVLIETTSVPLPHHSDMENII